MVYNTCTCKKTKDVVDEDCAKCRRDILPSLLEDYKAEDIFNDGTGLCLSVFQIIHRLLKTKNALGKITVNRELHRWSRRAQLAPNR